MGEEENTGKDREEDAKYPENRIYKGKKQPNLIQTGPLTSNVLWEGMEIWLSWKPTSQQALPPHPIQLVFRWTPVERKMYGCIPQRFALSLLK